MYSFCNDYSELCHEKILAAMAKANLEQNSGYSLDVHTENAIRKIKEEIGQNDCDVHILVGGTQTNAIAISGALRPHQAAICAHTGHINVHETGAIEACGHKVLTVESPDGKITPEQIPEKLMGIMTLVIVLKPEQPRSADASMRLLSIFDITV